MSKNWMWKAIATTTKWWNKDLVFVDYILPNYNILTTHPTNPAVLVKLDRPRKGVRLAFEISRKTERLTCAYNVLNRRLAKSKNLM